MKDNWQEKVANLDLPARRNGYESILVSHKLHDDLTLLKRQPFVPQVLAKADSISIIAYAIIKSWLICAISGYSCIKKYDSTSYVGMVPKKQGGSNGCITRYTAITQLRLSVWLSYVGSLHVQARPLPLRLERWLECSVQIANLTWAKLAFLHLLSSSSSSSFFSQASAITAEAMAIIRARRGGEFLSVLPARLGF